MTDQRELTGVSRAAAAPPGVRTIGILSVALLVDVVLTYLALVGAVVLAITVDPLGSSGPGLLVLAVVILLANLAALFLGAAQIAKRLPSGPRPFVQVSAAAAAAFVVASSLDIVFFGFADFSFTDTPAPHALAIRIVVAAVWALSAVVWASGCVVSERRRRLGGHYRALVILCGLAMGGLQVGLWFAFALLRPPS